MTYTDVKKMIYPRRVVAMLLAVLLLFHNPYLVRADEVAPSDEAELVEEPEEVVQSNCYNLSIMVTAPDDKLDYPEDFIPTVDIKVTNTGEERLTGLSVTADGFELWYALDPLLEYLPWNFIPEDQTEQKPEEELPKDDTVEEAAKPEDNSFEPAGEALQAEPSEELLEYADAVGVSFGDYNLPDTLETGASIYFRTQLSDELTMKMLVDAFSLKVAEIEEAYALPCVLEEDSEKEEPKPVEEEDTEGSPQEDVPEEVKEEAEEAVKEEAKEEVTIPETSDSPVKVLNRAGGYSMGGTFFAMGEACYFMAVDESLTEIEYCLGGVNGVATVENGVATIPIPDDVNDRLQIFYRDANGKQQAAVEEYVVNETDAPRVVFERVESEEASFVHVTLVEKGDIKSGIREYSVLMDDEPVTVDSQMVQKSISLVSGQSVPTLIEFDLPLMGSEEHAFEITVQDYVGNARHKSFTMSALESEVVSVVLPTTFKVLVLPENDQYQVIGEDFYVQNCSEFPVTISLDHSSVVIDPEIPEMILANQVIELGNDEGEIYHLQAPDAGLEKRCDLSLNLLRANEPEASYSLPEGNSYDVMSFDLQAAEGNEELSVQSKGFEAPRALTPDMAILNVKGVIARGTEHLWNENDLKIKMVFHFAKVEEELTKEELEALEKERLEKERIEQERLEQERLELEKQEQERRERERLEQELLEREEAGTGETETGETVTDAPGVDEPKGDEPGINEPGIDEPGMDEPKNDESGIDESGTDEPDTSADADNPDMTDNMPEGTPDDSKDTAPAVPDEAPLPAADAAQMPVEAPIEGGKSEENE